MKSFLHRHLDIGTKGGKRAAVCESDYGSVCQPVRPEPLQSRYCSSSGASAFGLFAIGALSIGAFAIGALAVGRLIIGKISVGKARIDRLDIGTLHVKNCECGSHKSPDGSDGSCCGK